MNDPIDPIGSKDLVYIEKHMRETLDLALKLLEYMSGLDFKEENQVPLALMVCAALMSKCIAPSCGRLHFMVIAGSIMDFVELTIRSDQDVQDTITELHLKLKGLIDGGDKDDQG